MSTIANPADFVLNTHLVSIPWGAIRLTGTRFQAVLGERNRDGTWRMAESREAFIIQSVPEIDVALLQPMPQTLVALATGILLRNGYRVIAVYNPESRGYVVSFSTWPTLLEGFAFRENTITQR